LVFVYLFFTPLSFFFLRWKIFERGRLSLWRRQVASWKRWAGDLEVWVANAGDLSSL